MGKRIEKRFLLYLLLALLFLAAVPSIAFRAQEPAESGSSSGPGERWFGDGATVESVREEVSGAQGAEADVVVVAADGTVRGSGPLAEGDLVEVFDSRGNLLSSVRNVRSAGPSSGPSSDAPSSGGESGPSPSSGGTPSSGKESGAPSDGGSSEGAGGDLSSEDGYYGFGGPVTVEELRDELDASGTAGSALTVVSPSGSERQGGAVCTGDVLTVLNADGTLQYRTTAVIPGDLARCGAPNAAAGRMLYAYLTDSGTLRGDQQRAADLNGDGSITTSDLLELKKILSSGN